MVCLGFEPGPQDGRCRRNHIAMAATQYFYRQKHIKTLFGLIKVMDFDFTAEF